MMIGMAWADEGAVAPAAGSPFGSPMVSMFLPLILIGVIFYFLVFRPESKKQSEHKSMLEALKKGDRVLTSGGLYGVVAGVHEKEEIVVLKIAENVKVEVSRSSITSVKAGEGVSIS